jgi:hypothetical protein
MRQETRGAISRLPPFIRICAVAASIPAALAAIPYSDLLPMSLLASAVWPQTLLTIAVAALAARFATRPSKAARFASVVMAGVSIGGGLAAFATSYYLDRAATGSKAPLELGPHFILAWQAWFAGAIVMAVPFTAYATARLSRPTESG